VLALLIGFAVTAALTITAHTLYKHNEDRVLGLRVKEEAQVLATGLPGVQTPLASAAALADATNGNRKKFRAFIRPYVGLGQGRAFVSVSLWQLNAIGRGPKVVVGTSPQLSTAAAKPFLTHAEMNAQLSVRPMLNGPAPDVGYAMTAHGASAYAAYAESFLPAQHYSPAPPNSAFSDLNYAIYLGNTQQTQNLVLTSVRHPPIPGHQAVAKIPFGDMVLTLAVSARRPLGGTLPQRLPWIIAITGAVLTLLASLLMFRLSQGRESATRLAHTLEDIAAENRRLYGEQRDIAQTLQHSLLPEELPRLHGADASARYQAGEQGVDVGGDWYDVITLADDRVLMVVGDVSGRGLRAATTMAALRHAIHAYAAENNSPAEILTKLSRLLSVTEGGKLATVMCAVLEIPEHRVTLANAGHLPPLLIDETGVGFLNGPVGPPIGMEQGASYQAKTYPVPSRATLLGFTDGLVERRGETLDQGLARLRRAAMSNHSALPELLESLLSNLRGDRPEDDTAIVGIRWQA
jgi:serine phosphatase RsbU (regulator of sigma subunit)